MKFKETINYLKRIYDEDTYVEVLMGNEEDLVYWLPLKMALPSAYANNKVAAFGSGSKKGTLRIWIKEA